MKIEDLIGRRFYTLAQKNDVYKIEKINDFGKVFLSFNGGEPFEYHLPDFCLNAIKNGTWILIEEENKTPFYLDEYIHNNDVEKREEAKHKNTQKISELPQSIDLLEPVESSEGVFSNMSVTEFIESQFLRKPKMLKDPIKTGKTEQIKITKSDSSEFTEGHLLKTLVELDFDIGVQSTIQKIQELLLVKGKEYRRNKNPYHNFEVAARKKNITPERALDGFLLKHLVSYDDMLNDIEHGVLPKIEVVEEKFNDIIVYFLIQKAQILNRINNGKNTHQ